MKIVMICDFFNEALEYQENLLAKYYVKHGHDVVVIASTFDSVFQFTADRHDRRATARSYMHRGAKVIKLPYRYNVLNRVRALRGVGAILQVEQPDLIFVHDIMPELLDAVRYKRHHPHCRVILDFHADYSNSAKNWLSLRVLHGVVRKTILRRARPHLSGIFPIVPASAVFLHEVYGVPHSEMELLPLGMDVDLGREVRESGAGRALRVRLGIAPGDLVLFTGGKLAPPKRTEVAIEAFLALSRTDAHLLIVGEAAPADATYKAMLLELAAGNPRIHFTGWLGSRDIYACLAAADLAVFPASQSILWQQAIGMGLPLIVGNSGHQDVSYLNEHDNIVMLPRSQITAAAIRDALGTVLGDERLRARMSAGARRVTEELLTWDRLILKTLERPA